MATTAPPSTPTQASGPRLSVRLDGLELATGTDGPLRGHPDPCILVGAYVVTPDAAYVVGRGFTRVKVSRRAPSTVAARAVILDAPLVVERQDALVALLCVALEENGGAGVQRVYQELQLADSLLCWSAHAPEPRPVALRHAATFGDRVPTVAWAVDVLSRGEPLSGLVADDVWVGAGLALLDVPSRGARTTTRFHLASQRATNDWVAIVSAEQRPGRR